MTYTLKLTDREVALLRACLMLTADDAHHNAEIGYERDIRHIINKVDRQVLEQRQQV